MKYLNTINVRSWFLAVAMVVFVGGTMLSAVTPNIVSAASGCNDSFLGFPAWYKGLPTVPGTCDIQSPTQNPSSKDSELSKFIWHIGLNLVEIALVAVGWISAFFTLYGGFLFITSQGKPDGAAKARMTMLNSIIGLLISLAAIFVVEFVIKGLLK